MKSYIPSRDVNPTIRLYIYEGWGSRSPSPVLINACDSRFTLRASGIDEFCRSMAQTGYAVVDVKYRLAPEHQFPAAFDDVEDVPGGNLALAVASSSLLFSTANKGNEESPFHTLPHSAFHLFSEFCHSCYGNPCDVDMRDPRSSPSYAARFLKHMLVITTGCVHD